MHDSSPVPIHKWYIQLVTVDIVIVMKLFLQQVQESGAGGGPKEERSNVPSLLLHKKYY